jgi:hypothetical protein
MKTLERIIFISGLICSFLGMIHLVTSLITIVLILEVCAYLFAGWILLYPKEDGYKFELIPFAVSYLIAQTFACLVFGINKWPLKEFFSYVTMVMILTTFIVLIINKNNLVSKYPVRQYLIRLLISLIFSAAPIWI